ncbi:MAG: hypothetical protein FWC79_05690 [Oscillospiraceae bacterium]|nr:hypothetical protein [Oscillospiraceae bacterium]
MNSNNLDNEVDDDFEHDFGQGNKGVKSKKKFIIIISCILAIVIIASLVVGLWLFTREEAEQEYDEEYVEEYFEDHELVGLWISSFNDGSIQYTFNLNRTGVRYSDGNLIEFTWSVEEPDTLIFYAIVTITYTFSIDGDELTLQDDYEEPSLFVRVVEEQVIEEFAEPYDEYEPPSTELTGNAFRVGWFDSISQENRRVILSTYDAFIEYFTEHTEHITDGRGAIISSSSDPILENYDSYFFNNNSLAVVYIEITSGSNRVDYAGSTVVGNSISIRYNIIRAGGFGTDDMQGYFVVVPVPNHVTAIL